MMTVPSDEFIQEREDEIARIITAKEELDKWRQALGVLHRRQKITPAYYQAWLKSFAIVDKGLAIGKHNTAVLRNGRKVKA